MKLSDIRTSWNHMSTAMLAEALDEEGFESRVMPYVEEMELRCGPDAISRWDIRDLAEWIQDEVESEMNDYIGSARLLEQWLMDCPMIYGYDDIAEAYVEMYYAQPCESFRAMDFGRKPAEYRRFRR